MVEWERLQSATKSKLLFLSTPTNKSYHNPQLLEVVLHIASLIIVQFWCSFLKCNIERSQFGFENWNGRTCPKVRSAFGGVGWLGGAVATPAFGTQAPSTTPPRCPRCLSLRSQVHLHCTVGMLTSTLLVSPGFVGA